MATKGNRAQGAVSGAAAGAGIGSMFPGPGTAIGAGLGSLIGLFGSGGEKPMSPELKALYDQQLNRQNEANPMVESIMRLAFNRLPKGATDGLAPMSLEEASTKIGGVSTPATGDYAEAPQVRQALQLARLRQQMAQPLIDAVMRLARQRMPKGYQNVANVGGTRPPDTRIPGPDITDPNDPSNRG